MTKKVKDQLTLGYALLIYMCIVVVLMTLIPFEFRRPGNIHLTWATDCPDLVTNIILFLPVGFIFKLCRRTNRDRFCMRVLIFGALLSVAIESAQLFAAGRYTSLIDVMMNGAGAWLGGLIFVFLKKNLKEEPTGRLPALELPLMNLVYLLIPLMWLTGLSAGEEVLRWWLVVLLGVFGGGVLLSIYLNRLKGSGDFGPYKLSGFAMGWFFIGALPMVFRYPLGFIGFGAGLGAAFQLLARGLKTGDRTERRFEIPTLKKLLPVYLIYLVLVAAWPTNYPISQWHVFIDFQEFTFRERNVFTFRFIDLIAAFTLCGYMIAEMRGRKNESMGKTLGWTLCFAAAAALFSEMLKTYPGFNGISLLPILIITAASIYGAVIYRLQLSAIGRLGP